MQNNRPKIIVRDLGTQSTLFETTLDEADKAYAYAAKLEEMGLEIEILSPTLGETLSQSLGHNADTMKNFNDDLMHEMDSHDAGCCFKQDDPKIN
jgi:hypothetical protein